VVDLEIWPLARITDSIPSRVLRAALFTLVPVAYLSMRFWQPLVTTQHFVDRAGLFCPVLMAATLLVSLLSWHRHRVVAVLGLVACFLWFIFWIQPVL
jgi:hypothetical protein